MAVDPNALCERLRGARDWRETTSGLAEAIWAEPRLALELADVLDAELERGHDLAIASVRSSLISLLGGSSDPAATLASVVLATRPWGARAFNALQVVGTRPADDLWEVLSAEVLRAEPEVGLLLVHELIVRGAVVQPSARPFLSWSQESGHPLAVLPDRLLAVEEDLPGLLPTWARHRAVRPPWSDDARSHRLGDVLSGIGARVPLDVGRILSPFRTSPGDQEVAAFERGVGFPPGAMTPELRTDSTCWEVPPGRLCGSLFSAAVGGGSRSQGGAWSRLRMWEALSEVVGHDWPSAIEAVDASLRRARLLSVRTDDPWFEDAWTASWFVVDAGERVVVIAALQGEP